MVQKYRNSGVIIQTEMERGPSGLCASAEMESRRAIARVPPTAIQLQCRNENGHRTRSKVSFGKLQPSQKIRIIRPFDWVALSLTHM